MMKYMQRFQQKSRRRKMCGRIEEGVHEQEDIEENTGADLCSCRKAGCSLAPGETDGTEAGSF